MGARTRSEAADAERPQGGGSNGRPSATFIIEALSEGRGTASIRCCPLLLFPPAAAGGGQDAAQRTGEGPEGTEGVEVTAPGSVDAAPPALGSCVCVGVPVVARFLPGPPFLWRPLSEEPGISAEWRYFVAGKRIRARRWEETNRKEGKTKRAGNKNHTE